MSIKRLACFSVFFVLFFALFSPVIVRVSGGDVTNGSSRIICRRTELWEMQCAPNGRLLEKSVYVRFEVYNNGSSPVRIRIVDRIGYINVSTLSVLYGTLEPSKTENFGNITRIIWENVTVGARKTLRYHYTAESLKAPPVAVNMTLLVNGKPAEITETELIYFTHANISDTLSFQITLQNILKPLYIAENRTAVQPLFCTVSVALSTNYFSGIKTSPKSNSTSTVADKTVMTWMTFLQNNSHTLEASADIIETGPWGEVALDPISIQVSSSSETLETYFENMVSNLNFSIELMENFIASSKELSNQTRQMGEALEGIAQATQEMSGNTTLLVDSLMLTASSIEMADDMLNESQTCLKRANETLVQFLDSHPEFTAQILPAVINLTSAYMLIDGVRKGYEYDGIIVPGLSQIADALYNIAQNVSLTGTVMQNMTVQLNGLAEALHLISEEANQTKMELEPALNELKTEKASLEDTLLTFNSKVITPFNLEIQPQDETFPPLEIRSENITLEQLNSNLWAVTAINASNPTNHTQIVYCLSLQLKNETTNLEPKVEVYVNGEWQPTEKSLLGLEYDQHNQILYLSPWKKLNASSNVNVLVDWAGRPLRIKVKSENEPTVDINVDYAEMLENVETEAEGRTNYMLVQPHLIIKNFTTPEPPQPPPEPTKSLFDAITEQLQKPETWLVTTLILLSIIVCYRIIKARKERERRIMREESAVLEEMEVERLLKEVEKLEKRLKE